VGVGGGDLREQQVLTELGGTEHADQREQSTAAGEGRPAPGDQRGEQGGQGDVGAGAARGGVGGDAERGGAHGEQHAMGVLALGSRSSVHGSQA
jgi:hypothetical protein